MTKEMIISSSAHETRVAILEEDLVAEIFIERERSRGVEVLHHVRLLNSQDRGLGHRRRSRHPLQLAREAALAEEMAYFEKGDDGLLSRV